MPRSASRSAYLESAGTSPHASRGSNLHLTSSPSMTAQNAIHRICTSTGAADRGNIFLTTKKDVEFLSKLIQEQGSVDVTQSDKDEWTKMVLKKEIKSAEREMRMLQMEKDTKRTDRSDPSIDASANGGGVGLAGSAGDVHTASPGLSHSQQSSTLQRAHAQGVSTETGAHTDASYEAKSTSMPRPSKRQSQTISPAPIKSSTSRLGSLSKLFA
ncbi:hypothetical protein HK105_202862 [Polyrhizophydium stewartii]|uniref:Uncharacterized protein n=1 Tax=Polyrhizophydium stewartii TaxID=2732419 RepID=A0ABR4NDK5_9FUNG